MVWLCRAIVERSILMDRRFDYVLLVELCLSLEEICASRLRYYDEMVNCIGRLRFWKGNGR